MNMHHTMRAMLLEYPIVHCRPFPADSFFAPFLALVLYANVFITLALYFISLRFHEIYLLFFSIGLTLDTIFNAALVYLLQGAVPIEGCNGPYDMPSVIAQHTGFFVTSVIVYSYQYRTPHIHALHHALLAGWATIVPFTLAFFNFNSLAQIVVGYLLGSLTGFAYQVAIVFPIIVPQFPALLEWRIVKWSGYENNLCKDAFLYASDDDSTVAVAFQYVPASTNKKSATTT